MCKKIDNFVDLTTSSERYVIRNIIKAASFSLYRTGANSVICRSIEGREPGNGDEVEIASHEEDEDDNGANDNGADNDDWTSYNV